MCAERRLCTQLSKCNKHKPCTRVSAPASLCRCHTGPESHGLATWLAIGIDTDDPTMLTDLQAHDEAWLELSEENLALHSSLLKLVDASLLRADSTSLESRIFKSPEYVPVLSLGPLYALISLLKLARFLIHVDEALTRAAMMVQGVQ